jgi:hypothetical protein
MLQTEQLRWSSNYLRSDASRQSALARATEMKLVSRGGSLVAHPCCCRGPPPGDEAERGLAPIFESPLPAPSPCSEADIEAQPTSLEPTTTVAAQLPLPPSCNPQTMVSPTIHRPANRFASPPITIRRTRRRATPCTTQAWTLGDFLKAATKDISAALPCPGRRPRRHALSFSPRRGRSAKRATAVATVAAPPTAERRA